MKASKQLLLKIAEESLEAGRGVIVKIAGAETACEITSIHTYCEGGATLIRIRQDNGWSSFFDPEDLTSVSTT